MDISIIIVNYRSWNPLLNCLESILLADKNNLDCEVIVVDNNSDDGQFEVFRKKFKDFTFIENQNNYGFANGCNIGTQQATGEFLLFLNPDTEIANNTLNILYSTYKKNPEIGVLSCLQTDRNKRFYNQKKIFPSLLFIFGTIRFLYRKIGPGFTATANVFYPDWVTGALLFISKDWFKKINGWNEDYWLYYEDVEICKKISQKKGKIAVCKATSIIHEHGGSSRNDFETALISKTEVLISEHIYIHNNFKTIAKTTAHLSLATITILEKSFLSIISLFLFTNIKLKTNRYLLKNIFIYYFGVLKNKTWLSPQSINYQR